MMNAIYVAAVVLITSTALYTGNRLPKHECPGKCDLEACPILTGRCLAGRVKDKCGCCDVCGTLEGQPCDRHLNRCGIGLECKVLADVGSICQCQYQVILCGTDNKTYTNLCQLLATSWLSERTSDLKVNRVGPCEPGAKIITAPDYVRNHTKSNVVLQCEAMGQPSPTMAWMFTRADNRTYTLPGDDSHTMISSRGGPGKLMVTSWLQIEDLQKSHEGDYTCMAFNKQGADRSKARIKVVEQ